MSATAKQRRLTAPAISAMKGQDPVVCLTAYTTPMAKLLDAHCDLLLVGDSLGMVMYGMDSTLDVSLDMMINHGKAVMRGSEKAAIVVDLPFGTYQESKEQAFRNAARVMAETGCTAVKLEGGEELAETVDFLCRRGIPVMGHVGLMPQQVQVTGGFKSQGRDRDTALQIEADARAIADAGAFSIVIEGTVEPVARRLTPELAIPTIGIGASPACDGQILVTEDLIGLFQDFTPKFVKRYADTAGVVEDAVEAWAKDVRDRSFPSLDQCFGVPTMVKDVSAG